MAETPEIPADPAGTPPAETEAPRVEPLESSLAGAEEAAPTAEGTPANIVEATSLEASVSPTVVGSYGTPAPSASSAVELAPPEAAPAAVVVGYGSAPESAPDPAGEGAVPAAAPATTPGGGPAAEAVAESPAAATVAPALAEQPAHEEPAGIATSVLVPALSAAEAGEGGEWDLLRGKLRAWFDNADLQGRWEGLGGPLRAAGLLLAAVVLLRLYSALLETLGDLPLLPRLLQLVGLVSVVQFALTRLVRTSERERILTSWRERWNDFRGRD